MLPLIQQVSSVLATTPERWQRLLASLAPDLLSKAPAAGEWSALECLGHLIDTERGVFPVRVQVFLSGGDSFPAFNPDAEGTKLDIASDLFALGERFAELRRSSLALLDRVTEGDLSRVARHSELGQVTLAQLLNEWAAHDLMHTVQAERALMQPFIQGSGAWQVYFKDHSVLPAFLPPETEIQGE